MLSSLRLAKNKERLRELGGGSVLYTHTHSGLDTSPKAGLTLQQNHDSSSSSALKTETKTAAALAGRQPPLPQERLSSRAARSAAGVSPMAATSSAVYSPSNRAAICPWASATFDLMGLKRMAWVEGLVR